MKDGDFSFPTTAILFYSGWVEGIGKRDTEGGKVCETEREL